MDQTWKALLDALVSLLTGGWPVAVVVVAIVYRDEIKKLLPRLRKAGPAEFDAIQQLEQQTPALLAKEVTPTADLDIPPPPLIAEIEAKMDVEISALPTEKRVPMLRRGYAMAVAFLQHERVYSVIVGSQIALLHLANASAIPESEVRSIYMKAVQDFASLYDGFPFETWIGFLVGQELLVKTGNNYGITVKGRDFLAYLAQIGKSESKYG